MPAPLFCFAYGWSVLRISIAFAGLALACGLFTSIPVALAACGASKVGTQRVIKVDTSRYREFRGKEKALGLRHKEVILTFDDGPLVGNTSRILDSLKRECVKATFFYVGRMARAYPRLVKRVVREGHTLAHHTWGHNRLPQYSNASARKHIDRGISRLQKIAYGDATTTPRIPFFRYPYLARNTRTDKILRAKGMVAFGANIDSLDWKRVSPDRLHNRIMRRLREEGRGIILMHDIQTRTAKMLPRLLRSLKAEGYKIVHMVPKGTPAPSIEPADTLVVASAEPEKALPLVGASGAPAINTDDAVASAMADAEALQDKAAITLAKAEGLSAQPARVTMKFNLAKPIEPSPRELAERKRRERAKNLRIALADAGVNEVDPNTTASNGVQLASVSPNVLNRVREEQSAPARTKPRKPALKVIAGERRKKSSKVAKRSKARKAQRRTALATSLVKRGNWKLRRSQWIIN